MDSMRLKDLVSIHTASINPMDAPEKLFHLYSLPSFDDNRKREEVLGRQIHSNKSLVPNRCILFNKLNVRFQRIWLIDNDDADKICSTEFLPLIVDENKIDFYYCYFLLHAPSITNYLTGQNTNTSGSHKRIDPDDFLSIEVQLPSLPEQKRIGKFLFDIEQKIIVNRQINDYLEAMARQLYDYWFVQFDFPNEHGKPYKSSGGKMVWNEKLKREIPEHWNSATLQDYLTIKNGKDHKSLIDGVFPVYGSGGLMRYVDSYLFEGESVLFPRKGSLNHIMYVNEAFWTVDTMFYTELKIPNSAKFIFYSVNGIDFTGLDSGTGVPSMTSTTLYSIKLLKPTPNLLQSFDEKIQPWFHSIENNRRIIVDSMKLRNELLPLLMNGQVSIKPLNNHLSHD